MSISRLITSVALAGATLVATAPSALADPEPNDHNCSGTVVSSLAAPEFGPLVVSGAQAQLIDNFGLANCGQPPRSNP